MNGRSRRQAHPWKNRIDYDRLWEEGDFVAKVRFFKALELFAPHKHFRLTHSAIRKYRYSLSRRPPLHLYLASRNAATNIDGDGYVWDRIVSDHCINNGIKTNVRKSR